jgi:hypothetical protein
MIVAPSLVFAHDLFGKPLRNFCGSCLADDLSRTRETGGENRAARGPFRRRIRQLAKASQIPPYFYGVGFSQMANHSWR